MNDHKDLRGHWYLSSFPRLSVGVEMGSRGLEEHQGFRLPRSQITCLSDSAIPAWTVLRVFEGEGERTDT